MKEFLKKHWALILAYFWHTDNTTKIGGGGITNPKPKIGGGGITNPPTKK